MTKPDYLTIPELATRYRTTAATVRYWRHISYGPRGARVGRRVLYPRTEVERWEAENDPASAPTAPDVAGQGSTAAEVELWASGDELNPRARCTCGHGGLGPAWHASTCPVPGELWATKARELAQRLDAK